MIEKQEMAKKIRQIIRQSDEQNYILEVKKVSPVTHLSKELICALQRKTSELLCTNILCADLIGLYSRYCIGINCYNDLIKKLMILSIG